MNRLLPALFLPLLLGAANLVPDPGFEEGESGWKHVTPGCGERTAAKARSGRRSFRLHNGEDGQKLGQLFSREIPLAAGTDAPCRLTFSLFHLGDGGVVYLRFLHREGNKFTPALAETGKPFTLRRPLGAANEWQPMAAECLIPPELLRQPLFVQIQFQRGPGSRVMELWLDDLSLELTGAPPPPPPAGNSRPLRMEAPPADDNGIAPLPKLPYAFAIKDGYLTRDGRPFYFAGNYGLGGGQWELPSLWMARLLGHTMVTLDWSKNFSFRQKKDEVLFSWNDSEPAISAVREVTRQNFIIEFDGGNYNYKQGFPPEALQSSEGLRRMYAPGNHFYAFDHNTPEGRQLIYHDWRSRFRFLKSMPLMAFECWNELGYTPSHSRVLQGYRDFAREKYGSLAEANRVWKRDFADWEAAVPPHLGRTAKDGTALHEYRNLMRAKHPEMYYDWLRFLQLDFMPGFQTMKEHFRTFSDAPWSVDWRGHRHYADGYAALDPDLLEEVIDINLLHTWITMFDYRGKPADPACVLESVTNGLLYHNFLRTNSRKPIINPEDIVTRVAAPGTDLAVMAKNCLAQFPARWKFTLEADNSGLEKDYHQPGFDDSPWGTMAVPGCWDETREYLGKKGFGWYRASFRLPGELRQSYLDGSRIFLLAGKGVAQSGVVWINGVEAGRPKGWNAEYRLNVGSLLKFGEENQITFLVDGSNYANGLRFYLHLLPHDLVSENRLYGQGEYASRLWTYMMQGASAVTLWNWDDRWRPFMPEVALEVNSAALVAMPTAREARAKEAGMLLPYLYFRGLPTRLENFYLDYMSWFGALAFRQLPTAVYSEKNIRRVTPEKTPILFYPSCRIVWGETFAHLKRYVEAGGVAVVTFDSFRQTFERYEDPDFDRYAGILRQGDYAGKPEIMLHGRAFPLKKGDMTGSIGVAVATDGATPLACYADGSPAVTEIRRGQGKVIFVAANLDLFAIHEWIAPLTAGIEPTIRLLDSGDKAEFAYLEGRISGDAKRFLAYVHNWGGVSREVAFAIPKRFLTGYNYRIRNLRDHRQPEATATAAELAKQGWKMTVEASRPAALLFEEVSESPLPLHTPSPLRLAAIRKIEELDRDTAPDAPGPKALFFARINRDYLGRKAYPQLAAFLQAEGIGSVEAPLETITPELLKKFNLVFLAEAHLDGIRPLEKPDHPLYEMLIDYVRNGGSLFIAGSSAPGSHLNGNQRLNAFFGRKLGWDRGPHPRNPASCGYDDAMQIKATDFADHPVTRHLESLQFFTLPTYRLKKGCELTPLVRTAENDQRAPNQPVVLGGDLGKGRAIFISDTLWMQPFRIEEADNAQFLMNVINYLTRREIRKYSPHELKTHLILPEESMRRIETEESSF